MYLRAAAIAGGGSRGLGFHAFPLGRIEPNHEFLVGPRVVLLAQAMSKGFAVPPGFVVLKKTFQDLVRDTSLKQTLPPLMKRIIGRSLTMGQASAEVQRLIREVEIPYHIMIDIERGCEALGLGRRPAGKTVTIRACSTDPRLSSAPLERAVAVARTADVGERVKTCWASSFDPNNLEVIRFQGMSFEEAAPCVLVSETVTAEVSGVMFSQSPTAPDSFQIEALWGFHEALGEGQFGPSLYLVPRRDLSKVASEETPQSWEYAAGQQGSLVRREVSPDKIGRAKLQKIQVEELARSALELEKIVGAPVGVEWAIHGGVVYILQLVALPQVPAAGEGEAAEGYIEEEEARARAVAAPRVEQEAVRPPLRPPPAVAPTTHAEPPAPAPPSAAAAPPMPSPTTHAPLKLLPVIQSSLFVLLPPGAGAAAAAHIPHAGLILDLPAWERLYPTADAQGRQALREALAGIASAVFPRPVLVELSDLDPGAYETFREHAAKNGDAINEAIRALMPGILSQLAVLRAVSAATGATNIHVIAPAVKAPHDAPLFRKVLAAAGLAGAGSPHTLLFAELRNPSSLLSGSGYAEEQDGIIVRAGRFMRALLAEAEVPRPAEPRAAAEPLPHPPASLVLSVMKVTRAFERAGGTVLVRLEDEGDLDTLWFYHELEVDGTITPLEAAEACTHAIVELEKRTSPAGRRKKGRLR